MTPKARTNSKKLSRFERFAIRATRWVGSTQSLIVHTALFIGVFSLSFFGVPIERILIAITTIVSYEAIYLSIFIQMTVNRNTSRLRAVSKDIEEIQEDVEDIQEDVDEIQKDVDEIQKDVDEIQEDVDEIQEDVDEIEKDELLRRVESSLAQLMKEISELKKK